MSDDGNKIVFFSSASNLVANDTNGVGDVFVRPHRDKTGDGVLIARQTRPDGDAALMQVRAAQTVRSTQIWR